MSGIELPGSVVVITGASSGIGRAAAVAFAREGANVVLAARRTELLKDAAAECVKAAKRARFKRARAIGVATDMTEPDDVANLVQVALKRFGRIDVWINNAGVGAVGAFTDVPIASHDQVVRTNLMGYMHGAHAVVPQFLRQGRGVLINNISFGAWVPAPFAAAYSASKFGIRGFSDALRAELQPSRDIHVCDVFPSFIDTPGVQHGANYTGRFLKPAPPLYGPDRVADAMVSLARSPRNSVTVGAVASFARLGYGLMPGLTRWMMRRFIEKYLDHAPRIATGPGNLFEPVPQGRGIEGGWRSRHGAGVATAWAAGALGIAGAVGAASYLGLHRSS